MSPVRIGGVLAKWDVALCHKRCDFSSGEPKHRANDFESMRMRQRFHATEARSSGSAEKIEKAGLDLIVCMVGQKNALAAMGLRAGAEKRIAQVSRGCLDGEFLPGGVRSNVSLSKIERIVEFSCGGRNERRIGVRRCATKAVVQVADDKLAVAQRVQAKQECGGIASA
jgi:hypothetical protein